MLVYEINRCLQYAKMLWTKVQFAAIAIITLVGLVLIPSAGVAAVESRVTIPDMPQLFISQFKIGGSGNQFVEIYNNSYAAINMSEVQLAYSNHYDLAKVSSGKLISLSGELGPGEYFIVNDSSLPMCYRAMVASASLSFNNSNGMVQLLRFEHENGRYVSRSLDTAAWSKSKIDKAGVAVLPSDANRSLLRKLPPSAEGDQWEEVYFNASCEKVVTASVTDHSEPALTYQFLTGDLPPVTYVSAPSGTATVQVNRNAGKAAPIVNELLPNPASPQTDADDEFIELYNPNDTVFDLSGFKLAFGSTNPREYTFPEGTLLQPKEFKAFTSGDTSISLSNSVAQVWLLDPNEQVIGQSEPYSKAKDGQAWALDNGKWVWTALATPNKANAISSNTGSGGGKPAAAVLGISDMSGSGAAGSAAAVGNTAETLNDAAPLHPAVLAVVGLAALGYAVYEYRHDMSNKIFQLKRYLRNRRAVRQKV